MMKLRILQRMLISTATVAVLLASVPLSANNNDQEEKIRIPVGERQVSAAEAIKNLEKRSELIVKLQKGECPEEMTLLSEEELEEAQSVFKDSAAGDTLKNSFNTSALLGAAAKTSLYTTTHEGAFHNPFSVSYLGDAVELEDGSIWNVSSDTRYQTLDWMTDDVIIILPNADWLSSYHFRLVNLNTGANVKANLYLGPIYNGLYTHWIVAIDYCRNEICLEDGSIWSMSYFDSSTTSGWLPNDTVIIGINDGWLSGTNPNILINVNMNNFAIGSCIY